AVYAGDLYLRRDLLVRGHDLTAIPPRDRVVERDRLEARRWSGFFAEPEIEHRELCELEQHFDAQRSRLSRVAGEGSLEVAFGEVDVLDGAPPAQAGAAGGGPTAGHPVDHQQHRVGQPSSRTEELLWAGAQVDDRRLAAKLEQGALILGDGEPHLLLQRLPEKVSEDRVER